ncbi:uncharacterized protein [Temnothorax nylanderi]|uniref:uncharacterized protein isoform X5 n=1 Tax=Temnothorax nylanderi TaxID=102681 RepID=UPI003A87860C
MSSNDTVALARQEAFKDFSYFDEETVPAEVSASQIYNNDEWKHYIEQCTIDETSEISINQSNSETPCDTASNKLLIDQLKAQNDEASQKIIHLEHLL